MKAATAAKRTRVSAKPSAKRKVARRKAGKKTRDLSWLLDRPLPPESELMSNHVIVMRNRQ